MRQKILTLFTYTIITLLSSTNVINGVSNETRDSNSFYLYNYNTIEFDQRDKWCK